MRSGRPRPRSDGVGWDAAERLDLFGWVTRGKFSGAVIGAYSLVAPSEGFERGKELRFEYHGLCNTELWAEYGFAESPHPSESPNDRPGIRCPTRPLAILLGPEVEGWAGQG
jgi:hypothetical protein